MRLLLNLSLLSAPLTGIGQYTARLLPHLLDDSRVSLCGFGRMGWVFSKEQIRALLEAPSSAPTLIKSLRPYDLCALRFAYFELRKMWLSLHKPRDYETWYYWEGGFLPMLARPKLITIHDLSHVRYPEFHPRARVQLLRHYLPSAMAQSRAILTVSDFSKSEIIEIFKIPSERIHVLPPSILPSFCPKSEQECAPLLQAHNLNYNGYLLSVATLEPRKNLERLLDAYMLLSPATQKAYPLALIGASGWLNHALSAKIMQLAQTGNVRLLGYIDSTQLPFLYAGARAFAYPSVYEGYGMPIAEALCCGIPSVVADCGAMRQTAGKHAIVADVFSVASIAKALQRALKSPRLDNRDMESVVFPKDAAQRLLKILESL